MYLIHGFSPEAACSIACGPGIRQSTTVKGKAGHSCLPCTQHEKRKEKPFEGGKVCLNWCREGFGLEKEQF